MTTATETQPTTMDTIEASRTDNCEQCGRPTSFERTNPATQPPEGEVCGQCQMWVCPDCVHEIGKPCPERATKAKPVITLSNFRVTYHAPRYEDGRVLYDGYCAILADDAALDGAEVRVFDVPDVDEGQLAAALFACDAMNAHERLIEVLGIARKMFDYIIELPQIEQAQTQAEQGVRMINDFLAELTTTSK